MFFCKRTKKVVKKLTENCRLIVRKDAATEITNDCQRLIGKQNREHGHMSPHRIHEHSFDTLSNRNDRLMPLIELSFSSSLTISLLLNELIIRY